MIGSMFDVAVESKKRIPLVSICLPTLNARRFLEPRMASILAQALTDWELIVCDSYSDDGTWEYLGQYKDDPRVHLYQVPKEGLYAGWNECLRRCRGEYVYIATADDTMQPECLDKMVAALDKVKSRSSFAKATADEKSKVEIETEEPTTTEYAEDTEKGMSGRETRSTLLQSGPKSLRSAVCRLPSDPKSLQSDLQSGALRPVDICVCRHDIIDDKGVIIPRREGDVERFLGKWMERPHVRSGLMDLLMMMTMDCHWGTMTSVLFRRRLLKHTGLFVTDHGNQGDRDWRRKASLYSDIVYLPETLATWRVHEEQATAISNVTRKYTSYENAAKTLTEVQQVVEYERNRFREINSSEHWDELEAKLLAHFRNAHWKKFNLNRAALCSSKRKFVAGAIAALLNEPRYFLSRLFSGFSWNDPSIVDEFVLLELLLEEWNIPAPRKL